MSTQQLANMSLDDLRLLIAEIVDERLQDRPWPGQITDESVEDVLEAMQRDLWTPPPGAKSSQEILREDRER
jgi:hypothetical protein